jgi:hypothetical protein
LWTPDYANFQRRPTISGIRMTGHNIRRRDLEMPRNAFVTCHD